MSGRGLRREAAKYNNTGGRFMIPTASSAKEEGLSFRKIGRELGNE